MYNALYGIENRMSALENTVDILKQNAPPGTFTPAPIAAVTPGAFGDVSWYVSPVTACNTFGISWFNTLAEAQVMCLQQGANRVTGEPICGGVQLTDGCLAQNAFGRIQLCIGSFTYIEDLQQVAGATCTLKHEHTLAFLYGW